MNNYPSQTGNPGLPTTPRSLKHANAALGIAPYYFDRRDHALIRIINDVAANASEPEYIQRQYYTYFHPHGIKEMAETRSLRIAYAMVRLLSSLEIGGMDDRLAALRSLRAEVLDTAEGPMPKNTARVLMHIMKEVVRARGDTLRQLMLAHDFRITATGKPRLVRQQLDRYHLLEMPEALNQIAFDDHVHDANTKGRKSSTHLIMDAWIKGIRRLRVVHYNYIEPRFAAELLEAARIMRIDMRIGIEFYARFRNKCINLIWVPRGFSDSQAFLCFLEEPAVAELMREGRQASAFQQDRVMERLKRFNEHDRQELNRHFDIDVPAIDPQDFIKFVGIGQKSTLHLEKFIQQKMHDAMHRRADVLRETHAGSDGQKREEIAAWFERMNRLDLEMIIADFLNPGRGHTTIQPKTPEEDDQDCIPTLMSQTPVSLLQRVSSLQSGHRITLNLSNLDVADVLELLYDSNGMISRLELFNLKDWADKNTAHIPAINRLQEAVNSQNPLLLKRVILDIIHKVEQENLTDRQDRLVKLKTILHDIISLQSMYHARPLKARLGSDSTGRSPRFHGMGMVVLETLPPKTRRRIIKDMDTGRERLPIHMSVYKRHTYITPQDGNRRQRPWWRRFSTKRMMDWSVQGDATRMEDNGNVITLGGVDRTINNGLWLEQKHREQSRKKVPIGYINSHLRNLFKIFIGFIPAFATFYLTKQWWVLAYLGAFIWFGITGIRNILQSVLGGGGFRRSPLLRWNAYVSWDRIADSLLFTGFSVPLLDYLTKTVVLEQMFGITIASAPILLYTIMALTNGLYLSTHNAFRGLPKAAVYGNFFRSALSIPIAIALNWLVAQLLTAAGAMAVSEILQKWAAIISKTASDMMAGIIEGTADRLKNIHIRYKDYRSKLKQLMDIYTQLELLYPEEESYELLNQSRAQRRRINQEAEDLENIITIHALDLLYFWMYQPRARSALHQLLTNISEEERHLLVTSQFTLLRQRDISQMFIDGVLGDDFAKALSFYLSRYPEYLEAIKAYA